MQSGFLSIYAQAIEDAPNPNQLDRFDGRPTCQFIPRLPGCPAVPA